MKELPAEPDSILEITLTLYKDHNYPYSQGGAYGDNACRLHILTEDWDEKTVTWNTQPAFDPNVYVDISASNDYDSLEIDLTDMIRTCITNGDPYYGFIIKNTIEEIYKSRNFYSSDGEVPSKRPKITISFRSTSQCMWYKLDGNLFYLGGNVSVGTADSHGYKLAVDGTIFSKEAVVNPGGWPDYVFEDEYDLMSLDHLRSHLKEHKHLPGIPDEEEVSTRGIGLGDINRKLLLKIEELTLYILEQDERVRSLERRLNNLESRN